MLSDFQIFFTGRLSGKFATNAYLNIPSHLQYVATADNYQNQHQLL